MALESFFAVPTVSNPQETHAASSLNHTSLLTSVEAMSCGMQDEEFNLDMLGVINDAICNPASVNNEIPGVHMDNTNIHPLVQSTNSKKIGPHCVLMWAFIHDTCINFCTKQNFLQH